MIRTGDRFGELGFDAIGAGQPISVLGLDLSNRRRNRMNGRIAEVTAQSITITVVQSYGNCPKYINLREIAGPPATPEPTEAVEANTLDAAAVAQIEAADTLFIASYVQDGSDAPYEGVDINHRGGHPGFVSVGGPQQITIPDYKGNYLFNTFGNLLLNPDAGVLFVDFETGDQLHVHGKAELVEGTDAVARFPGAQRLLRLKIEHVRRRPAATNLRWKFVEASPVSPKPLKEKD